MEQFWTCPVHENSPWTYLCEVHNTLGCFDCIAYRHSSCESILISEKVKTCDPDLLCSTTIEAIQPLKIKLREIIDIDIKHLNEVATQLKGVKETVHEYCEQLCHQIRRLERNLHEEIAKKIDSVVNAYEKRIASNTRCSEEMADALCHLEETRGNGSPSKKYIAAQMHMQTVEKGKEALAKCSSTVKTTIDIRLNKSLEKNIGSETIGQLEVRQARTYMSTYCTHLDNEQEKNFGSGPFFRGLFRKKVRAPSERQNQLHSQVQCNATAEENGFILISKQDKKKTLNFEFKKRCEAKLRTDAKTCGLLASTFLTNDMFAIIDSSNSKLKVFGPCFQMIASMNLKGCPRDVTAVSEDTVAVTLTWSKKIQFVAFDEGLELGRCIGTGTCECYGIDCCNQSLYLTCQDCHAIHIYDLDGKRLRTIETDNTGTRILQRLPKYIAVQPEKNTIYVTSASEIAAVDADNVRVKWRRPGSVSGGPVLLKDNRLLAACGEIPFIFDYNGKERKVSVTGEKMIFGHMCTNNSQTLLVCTDGICDKFNVYRVVDDDNN